MSPTIYREGGYRFFFFSREEPRQHVHVVCQTGEAKFWLEPQVALATCQRLNARQLQEIVAIIEEHKDEFIAAWLEHFPG
mgnify:CR=1 FL=1